MGQSEHVMKRFFPLLLALSIANGVLAQVQPDYKNWKTLAKVEYEKSSDEYGEIFVPRFNEEIQALAGTEITLPGYIIPFEGLFKPEEIIVSSLPIASCFFCGSGGPETVAKAYLNGETDYKSKLVLVTGTLELNDSDANDLMFILKDAKVELAK